MYIQITTYCGMRCPHCIFSCGTKAIRPEHMTREVFDMCLEAAEGCNVTLGGGEPTDHPKFWEFFGLAVGAADHVWMATNGKNADLVMALAGLSCSEGKFKLALSQDEWHDPIMPQVISKCMAMDVDMHTVHQISNNGTARESGCSTKNACDCGGTFIRPNGDILPCACDDAPILGNIKINGVEAATNLTSALGDIDDRCHRDWDDDDIRVLKFDHGIDVPDGDYYTPSEITEEDEEE